MRLATFARESPDEGTSRPENEENSHGAPKKNTKPKTMSTNQISRRRRKRLGEGGGLRSSMVLEERKELIDIFELTRLLSTTMSYPQIDYVVFDMDGAHSRYRAWQ